MEKERNDNSLFSMLADFYNRDNAFIVVWLWLWSIAIIAAAVWSAIKFSKTEDVKEMIMTATIFICCFVMMSMIKLFAWQQIICRCIKRYVDKVLNS